MRSILFILLTPVLAYGALYGYLWYETKSQADQAIQAAAPFAKLSYGNIHVSPLGDELGLNNIIISPVMSSDSFRIEKLRINAQHVGHILKLAGLLGKDQLPENVRLQLQGVHIDLESEIFTMLEQMQTQAAMMNPAQTSPAMFSPDALGCGGRSSFSISDYNDMGMGNIVTDISAENWYNPQLNRNNIKVDANFRNLYTVGLNFELDGTLKQLATQGNAASLPHTYITYRDTGYYKLRNKFCAIENDTSVDSYVDQNIDLLTSVLGATIPKESLAAYRRFMHNGGSLAVKLAPISELPMDGLGHYRPSDIVDMLGLSLRIDNTRVELDKIKWSGQPLTLAQKQVTKRGQKVDVKEQSTMPPRELITSKRPKRTVDTPSFHIIRVEQAPKYLNRLAEVTTADGRVRQGVLKEADEVQLLLVMKVTSGSLTYPVNLSEIERLRVRY